MDKEIFESGTINSGEHNRQGTRFFDENMVHPKATAIDAPKLIEFDWELLRRLLGEVKDDLSERDYEAMGIALREFLRWIVKGKKLHIIGRRAVALAWTVNPDIFNGPSQARLAKLVGCHKALLSEDATDARRRYDVRNRAQGHGWNYKKERGGRRAKRKGTAKQGKQSSA